MVEKKGGGSNFDVAYYVDKKLGLANNGIIIIQSNSTIKIHIKTTTLQHRLKYGQWKQPIVCSINMHKIIIINIYFSTLKLVLRFTIISNQFRHHQQKWIRRTGSVGDRWLTFHLTGAPERRIHRLRTGARTCWRLDQREASE